MGIPQVPDQVKKAPTVALRAFFAGIGKILLTADRPQASPSGTGPRHAAPGRRAARAGAAAQSAERWRSLDETGNVRVLAAEDSPGGMVLTPGGARTAASAKGPAGVPEVTMAPVATRPLTGNVPIGAGFVVHELPLAGYDTMSVGAIRARLRGLDVEQLQALLVHEQKNSERPEVIAMIERRILKIESGE
ncbi:MAG TPA: hypothetical protein VEJ42_09805 [Streptosporangiaceae bacterium]|nr:hypothetical protein [Streptosporangiaceae bacterium]